MAKKLKKQKSRKLDKVILVAVILLVLCAVYFVSNNKKLQSFRGVDNKLQQTQNSSSTKEQKALDCARKIDQNKSLSYDNKKEKAGDCLFMGCGDFF